jgi:uncharacterized membrane protein YccC
MHLPLITTAGFGPSWLRHRTRVWDTLRMTAAAAVTFALGTTLGLSQSFWAVIAAVVATQGSLGGTLKASFEQFIGSVFGAAWGAAITLAIPHQTPWMLGLALVIAVAPLAWLTTFSAGFRIAPITAILVLLSSMGITMGPVDFAVERLLEIGLGCAVGLGVSVLLVPAHAYDAVLRLAGQVAGLLADQLDVLATIWEHPEIDVSALPTEIRMGLGKLEALAEEAARERRTYLAKEPDPEPLPRTLARLHTDISTLGRILTKPLPEAVHQHLAEPWSRVARATAQVLRHISLALPARRSPPTLDPVIEAIAAYEAAVDGIRRTGITKDLPNESVGRVFALGFVLEQFQRNLGDLLSRTREAQSAGPGPLKP